MIPQNTIQAIKNQTDLVKYLQSRGLQLKKSGREYVGLCPFHDDHNPSFSVNPSVNLWHCFACDIGGDVIKFVELYDKVSFNEAIEILGGKAYPPAGGQADKADPDVHGGASGRPALLKMAFDFYCRTFSEDRCGPEYLQSRNLADPQLFKSFSFGFANGSLIKTLSSDLKAQLKETGILNKSPKGQAGCEFFKDCVIFPLTDYRGNPL